jgi:tripartite-type tricarboxylate transporter receptor subunit TctC
MQRSWRGHCVHWRISRKSSAFRSANGCGLTISETVPGYEASGWFGVGVPKGTPTEVIEKLNKEINAGLADPIIMSRLADLGSTVLPLSPTDLGKLATEETEKWGKVIRAANIKPE